MEISFKIFTIIFIFLMIYLMNRFVVKNMIKLVIGFHKKYNANNIEKQPIKFLIENENYIYYFFAGFYWFGGVTIALSFIS